MSSRFFWTSDRVREALDLPTATEHREYRGVSTDSRTIRPGELFVGLPGERYDGADFVAQAAESGARGAIVERYPGDVPDDLELILVDDALEALGELARYRRQAADAGVIGVTGTNGKTTTKELIAALLGPNSYVSPGNYNNLVGLPLSILGAPETAAFWVLELASNRPGEIRRLGRIARADLGVITNVGPGHLEGLGSVESVLDEKLSLLETLATEGVSVVGDEPPELPAAARTIHPRVIVAGLGARADERPEEWTSSTRGLCWRWRGAEFDLATPGEHMLRNAMIALTVARELGVEAGEAVRRMSALRLPSMRNEIRDVGDLTLLLDCYNANPGSFRAALSVLDSLGRGRRRAAIVGTMLELGADSPGLHEQVARQIAAADLDLVAATGAFVEAFDELGAKRPGHLVRVEDPLQAYEAFAARLHGDELVLLKASRGIRLERLVPLFERDFGDRKSNEVVSRE